MGVGVWEFGSVGVLGVNEWMMEKDYNIKNSNNIILKIGIWYFFIICNLEFGAWNLCQLINNLAFC